ncbi:hypothetical protein GCM10010404_90120 [Nonomuraea africana]|uniref:DUF317 domain-containing protein n=1 Tax=Nonomuraea africana TaxID=46171 RepID=A0ABR9KDQ8_9ACTN|nr:hypothetical protein [Nonomuraea africana]MBE1560122.1 hypothetical protein [Nonomuraea africana]
MSFTHPDLNLTDPTKGYAHFVLYTEARIGVAGAAWNATVSIERQSPYAREWLDRLVRCEPNPLHTTLVDNQAIPKLFHPCVDDDKNSPSAVEGSGCICHRTWYDPEFGLPVVGEHYRTVGGDTDRWTYTTYAPLDLRPRDAFAYLVIDRTSGLFWIRTTAGTLSLLPEHHSCGYDVGRTGGGPCAFAEYLHKLVASDGADTAIGGLPHGQSADPQILAWVTSTDAKRTQELTMEDLKTIQRG